MPSLERDKDTEATRRQPSQQPLWHEILGKQMLLMTLIKVSFRLLINESSNTCVSLLVYANNGCCEKEIFSSGGDLNRPQQRVKSAFVFISRNKWDVRITWMMIYQCCIYSLFQCSPRARKKSITSPVINNLINVRFPFAGLNSNVKNTGTFCIEFHLNQAYSTEALE